MKRKYDLVCFDLDGTLVECDKGKVFWEVVLEDIYGSNKISDERYDRYLKGELLFNDWVDLDIGDWKKHSMTKNKLFELSKKVRLNKGAKETLRELKKRGKKLAVVSGSIDIVLDAVFPEHPFDDIFINKIIFDDAGNIIRWEKTPCNDHGKGDILRMISKRENIPLSRIAFVGDHENDISAAEIAGLSISFNSKSKNLDKICDVVITKKDMREILNYIV